MPGYKSKKEGKDQESIQSSTTPDTGYQWESDELTIRHHKRERQEVSPFPAGDKIKVKSLVYSRAKTKGNTKCTPCSLQINFI